MGGGNKYIFVHQVWVKKTVFDTDILSNTPNSSYVFVMSAKKNTISHVPNFLCFCAAFLLSAGSQNMYVHFLPPQLLGPWWRHQMESFSASLALCAGNSPVPVNSPHKGQWRENLMFPLICAWINDWVNNREAGDLRRHRGHYDVNIMHWQIMPACHENVRS